MGDEDYTLQREMLEDKTRVIIGNQVKFSNFADTRPNCISFPEEREFSQRKMISDPAG